MEPITMFAATIGAISACHLTFSAAKNLGIGSNGSKTVDSERKDWYCFFKVSDLVGNDTTTSTETARQNAELERRREAERQRPRLRA